MVENTHTHTSKEIASVNLKLENKQEYSQLNYELLEERQEAGVWIQSRLSYLLAV